MIRPPCGGASTVLCLLVAAPAAQLTVLPPGFQATPLASGLACTGSDMAVDRAGNVYLIDDAVDFFGDDSITRVRPGGAVEPGHAGGLGSAEQLAYHPLEGEVYLVADTCPPCEDGTTEVLRIDSDGGASLAFVFIGIPYGRGLAIDNAGTFYLTTGSQLFSFVPGSGTFLVQPKLVYLTDVPGDRLLALPNGDVLIQDGGVVRRWVASTRTLDPSPCYVNPAPAGALLGLTRNPFHAFGHGAFAGTGPNAVGGGDAAFVGGGCGAPIQFATEFTTSPEGLTSVASGLRRDLYWFTRSESSPGAGDAGRLLRITQTPADGSAGSLLVTSAPPGHDLRMQSAGAFVPYLLYLEVAPHPGFKFLPPCGVLEVIPRTPQVYSGQTDAQGVAIVSGMVLPGAPATRVGAQAAFLEPGPHCGTLRLSNPVSFLVP